MARRQKASSKTRSQPSPQREETLRQLLKRERLQRKQALAREKQALAREIEALAREKEALEQQAATSEILRVISSSPSDTQPVFDAIATNAARLCEADSLGVFRVEGNELRMVAHFGRFADTPKARSVGDTFALTRGSLVGRALLERRTVHVHDLTAEPDEEWPEAKAVQRAIGHRTALAIPLMRAGVGIGAIFTRRMEVRPFSDKHIALLKTFADQAVIAIENARLFNETKEALERQTATAEILKVIASSPSDVQPVFEAVAERAAQLCNAANASVVIAEGTVLRRVATFGHSMPLTGRPARTTWINGRAFLERRTVHVEDAAAVLDDYPEARENQQKLGFRTMVSVPMIREGRAIGTIGVWRREVKPFSKAELELLETFADQAVIAIENVRLFNETKEALEQQTAISEILRVISDSPTDVQPVLDAVAVRAARICDATDARIFLIDGQTTRHAAGFGDVPGTVDAPLDRASAVGRAAIDRAPVHVEDMQSASEDEYPMGRIVSRQLGWHTILAVPLLREGRSLGVIALRRMEVRSFHDKQIALLKTFADQAAIAIENVRLFNETKEALDRQTATAKILAVISSNPTDTMPVFDAIVQSALRLFEGLGVGIALKDGNGIRIVAEGGGGVFRADPGNVRPLDRYSVAGRVICDCEVVNIANTEASDAPWRTRDRARELGYRAIAGAPMRRAGLAIGSLAVMRKEPGALSEKQLQLLQAFADQAVIALENARLFNETKEALERQTATSEILKVISRTTFDLQPVLEIVLSNARKLCEADSGIIFRPDDEGNYRPVAFAAPIHERMRPTRELFERAPIRVDRSSATGRAIVEGVTVHVPDVMTDPEYRRLDIATVGDYRSILAVPMLRAGMPIGVLTLSRVGEAKPFSDKQIELVTVFADQAVIAIENVRLFREIQEKSAQLEVANKHKSDFLANMSHELRTPLNAIIGFSEAMMDKLFGELNEKQSEYLKDIHESGKHLLSLINDILDLSKIEAGKMELELSTFHLPTAVSNAVTLVRERAMRHGVALNVDIDERLGEFQADERKLKQVLLNLLSNAVKFTPDGGRVEVSAKLDTDKVQIAVKDTGVGIAPADQASLFEEFKQLGKDSSRKAEGTGLGLALTKRLVELHGGQILVDSAVGKGSTFRVLLPVSPTG